MGRCPLIRSPFTCSCWPDGNVEGTGIVTIIRFPGTAPGGTVRENCPAAVWKVSLSPGDACGGTSSASFAVFCGAAAIVVGGAAIVERESQNQCGVSQSVFLGRNVKIQDLGVTRG